MERLRGSGRGSTGRVRSEKREIERFGSGSDFRRIFRIFRVLFIRVRFVFLIKTRPVLKTIRT